MQSPTLSSITTFEEFEKLKTTSKVFEEVAKEIISQNGLQLESLKPFADGTNIVFAYGEDKVIKIFPPFHYDQYKSEILVLKHLQGKLSTKTPDVQHQGEFEGWPYIIMSRLTGAPLETLWEAMDYNNKLVIIKELGALIKEVHSLPTHGLKEIDCHWEQFIDKQIAHCIEHHKSRGLSKNLLEQIPPYLEPIVASLKLIQKPVLLTGEYTPMNFLVKKACGAWHIEALIDFGDSMLGAPEYDLLGPAAFLIQGDKPMLKAFLISYGYSLEMLTKGLSHKLTALMLLHKHSNLNVQVRIPDWQEKVNSLMGLESLLWGF